MEPVEELVIDTNEEYSNKVASVLSTLRAEMQNMETDPGLVKCIIFIKFSPEIYWDLEMSF
jgi:predicted membrane GTPase involved in stress response